MFAAYKNILATLLLIPLVGNVGAQYSGFGVKGGPQICTFDAIKIRTTIAPGGTIGVYAPISAAARLEIQPELLLSMMGTGLIEPDGDRYQLRTFYIQAPVSAKYFLGTAFNVQGGFQFGKLLLAHRVNPEEEVNVRDQFNTFDFGLNLGLGFDLLRGTDISLRYYSGMSLLLKNDDALYPHNRSLQFTLGKRLVQMKRRPAGRRHK